MNTDMIGNRLKADGSLMKKFQNLIFKISGFNTQNDGSCSDINECSVNGGSCSGGCSNSNGGYSCSCPDNFYKVQNG